MNLDEFEVNLERVIEDKQTHSIIRLLAVDMQKNPYITVGEWLKSLSNKDIQSLVEDLADADDMNDAGMQSLILGTLMLSRAEQVFIESDEELAKAAEMFRIFIVISSLDRKGLAKAIYQNMSFGEDAKNLHVAEKI
jgi:hypothetical protein